MAADPKVNKKRLVLLLWVLVATFYFYLSFDYIRIEMNDDKLAKYVNYIVQLAGNENHTPREIRALLLVRADELGISLTTDQIKIKGTGRELKVSVEYDMNVEIPIFHRGFYRKHYSHNISYRQPR
jgi:hypothetical protein